MVIRFVGQYLLSRGVIDSRELLAAVALQAKQNALIAERAVESSFMAAEEAEWVVEFQRTRDVRFTEAALALGSITLQDAKDLAHFETSTHLSLAGAVIELGYAFEEVVDQCLVDFAEHCGGGSVLQLTIPEEFALPDIAQMFFDTTHRVLSRNADLHNRVDSVSMVTDSLKLEGLAVSIPLVGDVEGEFCVGMSVRTARQVAVHMLGEELQSDADCLDMTREFANTVAGGATARLAATGLLVDMGPPEDVSGPRPLQGHDALCVELVTEVDPLYACITLHEAA